MTSKTLLSLTALATVSLLAAGCDDDDPVGVDDTGTVQAALVDTPTQQTAGALAATPPRFQQLQLDFGGAFAGTTRVEIYSPADDSWVEIAGTSSTQLDLLSTDSAMLGGAVELDAGVSYTRVRLTITNGEAVVEAGATIGGIVLESDVSLDLGGDDAVVIEKDIALTVGSDTTTDLVIDLNSEGWVTANNLQDGVVSEAEMTAAASVTTNGG